MLKSECALIYLYVDKAKTTKKKIYDKNND